MYRSLAAPTAITARNSVWNDQPTPLKPMMLGNPAHAHPSPSNNAIQSASTHHHDRVPPISERPPSLKPLDLGHPSLVGRMSLHGRRKSATTLIKRVSRPTDFRRLEYTEKLRTSLKPLQLDPVVLREANKADLIKRGAYLDLDSSPLPEHSAMTDDCTRRSYRATRGTPWERCQQLAASASSSSPAAIAGERGQGILAPPEKPEPKRPTLSAQSSSSSLQSLRHQGMESGVLATSTPSSEKTRLHRRRSNHMGTGDSADLDLEKEMLELNTIIEERRAGAARPRSAALQHVPAVAPSMDVTARSETLTDIASALSRPTSPPAPEASHQLASPAIPPTSPAKSRLSRPFMSMPDVTIAQEEDQHQHQHQQQQHIRRPSSRITGWLSTLLSSSPSQTTSAFANPPPPERAAVLSSSSRHRTTSEASLCTTTTRTDPDSPATTTTSTSTPTAPSPDLSRAHSRPVTVDGLLDARAREVGAWPQMRRQSHPGQVGLAL
ncbi:Hypothetical predicted protein [Lecanosticta acicola]|uniref:Uncharacterized protein n=1 Tax=Lecanosticta acicola TaxID=111012 RepID=A0AAI8Z8X4_9PEZI|nr:Hypothetical predicted protein [Lecanosticta acicola]